MPALIHPIRNKAGAHVAMVAEGPKLAHQQQWLKSPAAAAGGGEAGFQLKLKATPTLCLVRRRRRRRRRTPLPTPLGRRGMLL